jgi:hypothetical protein
MQTRVMAATSGGFFKCRSVRPPIPRQQIVDPVSGMFGNVRQNIGEPDLRIDIVQFGGDDQAVHDCRPAAAAIGAAEQPGFAPEGNRPVILPMSDRRSRFIIAGTHSMGGVFVASMLSGAPAARLFTSR